MSPNYSGKAEPDLLIIYKATSDPDTLYMHQAMNQPDSQKFYKVMKQQWEYQLNIVNFSVI